MAPGRQASQNGLPFYKIVLVGEVGVGKSSLWYRFKTGRGAQERLSTIGIDSTRKTWTVPGSGPEDDRVELHLWDTGGLEKRYSSLTKNYYRNVDVVVFVFSVDSLTSLSYLGSWLRDAEAYAGDGTLYFFVCNKVDLPEAEHQVYTADIDLFHSTHVAKDKKLSTAFHDRLVRTSAMDLDNPGLDEVMDRIVLHLQSGGQPGNALGNSITLKKEERASGTRAPCPCQISQ